MNTLSLKKCEHKEMDAEGKSYFQYILLTIGIYTESYMGISNGGTIENIFGLSAHHSSLSVFTYE